MKIYHPTLKKYIEVPDEVAARIATQGGEDQVVSAAQQMNTPQNAPSDARTYFQQLYDAQTTLKNKNAVAAAWEARSGTKLFAEEETKVSEADKTRAAKKAEAARIIEQLEDMYFASKDLSSGRLGGIGETIKAQFGFNEPLKSYDAIISSIRPTLARAAGDVGALSEPEQRAAVKPLPNGYSTPEEAISGFSAIRKRFGLDLRDYNDLLDEETKVKIAPDYWNTLQKRLGSERTLDDIYSERKKK